MLNVGVSEARGKIAEILDRVGRGKERIAVGDEGAPLAVLVPVEDLGLLEGHGGPALADGEQRFRDFAETASDWFWETDMEQRFTYYSGSGPLDSVLGLKSPGSIIGKTRREVWRGSDDPDPIDAIADYMARGAAFSSLEFSHRDPERGLVHISLSGKPVTDDRGSVVAYRGTGRDITERKRSEEEGRDSRDRIRLIADNLPVFIAYFDTEQRFRFVNKTAQEWFARPLEEILGRTIREIIGPKAHDQLGDHLQAALSNKEQRFEQIRAYPDGNTRAVETTYVPHLDASGDAQGCFALVHDVTERKRAEQALQESEALFKAFIDNAPSEVFIRDTRGRFVLVNRAWETAQGMPIARAIGLTVHDVFPKNRAEAFAA